MLDIPDWMSQKSIFPSTQSRSNTFRNAQSVADHANRGNKGVDVKPQHVKNYMLLFVNCLIENPAFDSQTKDTLTTRPREFGSEAAVSDKFMKQSMYLHSA